MRGEIDEVKEVMVANIERVLERGEKIELLVDKTDNLNQQAFRFKKQSTYLRRALWWKNCKLVGRRAARGASRNARGCLQCAPLDTCPCHVRTARPRAGDAHLCRGERDHPPDRDEHMRRHFPKVREPITQPWRIRTRPQASLTLVSCLMTMTSRAPAFTVPSARQHRRRPGAALSLRDWRRTARTFSTARLSVAVSHCARRTQ